MRVLVETFFPADAARALPQEVAAELGPARGRHVLDDEQRLVLHVGVLVPAALEEVVLDLLAGVEGRERHLRDLPVHVARRRRLVARRRARQHAPVHGLPKLCGRASHARRVFLVRRRGGASGKSASLAHCCRLRCKPRRRSASSAAARGASGRVLAFACDASGTRRRRGLPDLRRRGVAEDVDVHKPPNLDFSREVLAQEGALKSGASRICRRR